jgi:hypothetical protein
MVNPSLSTWTPENFSGTYDRVWRGPDMLFHLRRSIINVIVGRALIAPSGNYL